MQLRRDLATPGGLLAAPLGIALLDTAGINVDAIERRVPTQIDVTVFDAAHDVEAVRFFGEIVREGRSQMFTRARIEDVAHPGRVIGFGSTSWAVQAPTPPGFVYVDPGPVSPTPPTFRPSSTRCVVPRPGGSYVLDGLSARVGADSLHQGPIQVMLEAAALDVASKAAGTDAIYAEHTGATLVQRGKTGPFVATATCWPTTGRPSPASRSCATTAKAGVSSRPASRSTAAVDRFRGTSLGASARVGATVRARRRAVTVRAPAAAAYQPDPRRRRTTRRGNAGANVDVDGEAAVVLTSGPRRCCTTEATGCSRVDGSIPRPTPPRVMPPAARPTRSSVSRRIVSRSSGSSTRTAPSSPAS